MNLGPFAPLVGYVIAITGAVTCIAFLIFGRSGKWLTPGEEMPEAPPRIAAIISAVGIVGLWLIAAPETKGILWIVALVSGGCAFVLFLLYYFAYECLLYYKEVPTTSSTTRRIRLIGGFKLKPEAQRQKEEHKVETQELLKGAAYDPDYLWSRTSRQSGKLLIVGLFILMMVGGSVAISALGLAVQVTLTNRPATEVIETEDAPGAVPIEELGKQPQPHSQ